jgi:hypothetical protein
MLGHGRCFTVCLERNMKRGRRCFGGNRSRKSTRPTRQQLQEMPLEVEAGSEGKGCIPSILDVRVHSHLGSARRREINAVSFFFLPSVFSFKNIHDAPPGKRCVSNRYYFGIQRPRFEGNWASGRGAIRHLSFFVCINWERQRTKTPQAQSAQQPSPSAVVT